MAVSHKYVYVCRSNHNLQQLEQNEHSQTLHTFQPDADYAMRIQDSLHFSATSYDKRIHDKDYTFGELARDIYLKRCHIASSTTSAAAGIACAHVSGGVSLFGSAYAGRNVSVEKQKLTLLEHLWESTGVEPLPHRHIKDTVIPVVITTAVGVFTFSVDLGLSNAVANAAQAGIPGYELAISSHITGGEFSGVEKGMGWVGERINQKIAGHGEHIQHSNQKIQPLINMRNEMLRDSELRGGRHGAAPGQRIDG